MNRHEALEVIDDLIRATEHYHPDGSDGSALTPGQDWELTHILYAEDNPHGSYQFYGFISHNTTANSYRTILRGTQNIVEAFVDAMVFLTPCPWLDGSRVHSGILNIYNTLQAVPITISTASQIDANTAKQFPLALDYLKSLNGSIVIGGHSLGAVMATMLASHLSQKAVTSTVYTFGSPQVGDQAFANDYNAKVPNTWRYAHQFDFVVYLPRQIAKLPANMLPDNIDNIVDMVNDYVHVNTHKGLMATFSDHLAVIKALTSGDIAHFHHLSTYKETI